MKSVIVLLLVCAQIAIAVKVGAAEGWGAALVFILAGTFFLGLVAGITNSLLHPFARPRRG